MSGDDLCSQDSALYSQLSHLYERVFDRVLGPRIRWTIRSLKIPAGAKVLEVGVGTGLSLEAYPELAEVTAIDLSPEMLAQADKKVRQHAWRHITLSQMDALKMDFPDDTFDYVMAFHVASVVPDADQFMREVLRVLKPDGITVIINHFRSENRLLAPMVDLLNPLTRRIGWRTTLRYSELVEKYPLSVQDRFKTSKQSLFTVVVAEKLSGDNDRRLPAEDSATRSCSIRPWKSIRQACVGSDGLSAAEAPEGRRKLRIGRRI
jgi:phosphatidylethanolamine/phosphatidyl-N-methylethanolamine N-methyltransferase